MISKTNQLHSSHRLAFPMEPQQCEPASRAQLLQRLRYALEYLKTSAELDTEILLKMVPVLTKAVVISRVGKRPDHPPLRPTSSEGTEHVGKRKLSENLDIQGQALPVSHADTHLEKSPRDNEITSDCVPSESSDAMPSLRMLLDSQQSQTFRPGGVADISIKSFAYIQPRIAAIHRVVIIHEVLVQALKSVGVQDGLWNVKIVAAIEKALELSILSPTEAKFCHVEATIARQEHSLVFENESADVAPTNIK